MLTEKDYVLNLLASDFEGDQDEPKVLDDMDPEDNDEDGEADGDGEVPEGEE